MNTQRQVNDFDFSKKIVEDPVIKNEKHSSAILKSIKQTGNFVSNIFKKTIFQGLMIASIVIFFVGIVIIPFAKGIYQNNKEQERTQVEKIASISPQEFENMMAFVKQQLQVGEQVAARGLFAGDYMMKNNKYNMSYASDKKSDIMKYQRENEKFLYGRIVLLNELYGKIHKKDLDNIESKQLERFIFWYNSYKNGNKFINEELRDTVDHLIVNTDITDEINKKYPDPLKSN